MNRRDAATALVWALSALACAASAADRRDALPLAGEITNPDWAAKPGAEEISRFYPAFAQFVGLTGNAIIHCTVTALGQLEGCVVEQETPRGLGFGDAALALAPYFRMKPMTVDGAPVEGGTFSIKIRFQMPTETVVEPPKASTPDAATMALARRLVALFDRGRQMEAAFDVAMGRSQEMLPKGDDGEPTPEAAKALAALKAAYSAAGGAYLDKYAAAYAAKFSPAELKEIVTFLESPAGRAWTDRQPEVSRQLLDSGRDFWFGVREDARKRFCAEVACPTLPAAPPIAAGKPQTPPTPSKP